MEKLLNYFSSEDQEVVTRMANVGPPGVERSQLLGHNILPGFSANAAKYAYEKWSFRKNDVLIPTYPKTGTNFVCDVVRRIQYQDDATLELSYLLPTSLFFLEFEADETAEKKFEIFDKMPFQRRLLASHLPADLINVEKIQKANAKVVIPIRNPKDQILSWLKFGQKIPLGQVDPWKTMFTSGWDKFLDHVIAGDFDMNMKPGEWYPEYMLSWYKHRDSKTVYFINFEDLKKNPVEEIKLLAEFLEIPLSDEKANEIAAKTSFEKMKEDTETTSNQMLKWFRTLNMRKGGVGGWKDHFTVSQSERIDAIMEEKLKDTDIKFIYE